MSRILGTSESISLSGRCFTRIDRHTSAGGATYLVGIVVTPLGIVWSYSDDDRSRLDFVRHDRQHIRIFERRMTTRGLSIAAHRFAKEVTYGRARP